MKFAESQTTSRFISVSAFLALVAIAPNSIDPINSVKYQFILFMGIFCLINILKLFRETKFKSIKLQSTVLILFISCGLIILYFSPGNIRQQLYGSFGRNNGFITQICLMLIFLFLINFKKISSIQLILKSFFLGTSISAMYGLIQIFNLDPVNWSGDGRQIIGFVGNTNFQSSLMGLGSVLILYQIKSLRTWTKFKTILLVDLIIHIIVLEETKAIQGFFIFFSIPIILIIIKIIRIESDLIRNICLMLNLGIVFIILTIFIRTDAVTKISFFQTIDIRKNYWIAAINMFYHHPVIGVGFDSYGDWYRAYRPEILNTPTSVVSNSAHNYPLELLATLGTIGFAFYAFAYIFVARCAFLQIRTRTQIPNETMLILFLFTGFLLQSLISPVQLGLLVWQVIFGACLVALSRISADSVKHKPNNKTKQDEKRYGSFVFVISAGIIIASPVFLYQVDVRRALDSQDFSRIQKSALKYPADPVILYQLSAIADYNKLKKERMQLLLSAVDSNPNFYEGWEKIYIYSNPTSKLNLQALKQMKRLEPKWDEILRQLKKSYGNPS